jgi:hippurate hydrolase
MIADGLFDRFPCDAIFGIHNHPGIPVGTFGVRPGPFMASSDAFFVTVREGDTPHVQISRLTPS